MRRKTFTHEFKQECVNLVLQHNYPVPLHLNNGEYRSLKSRYVSFRATMTC
ncbi:transposase-like protein [Serratia sp. 509]